MENKVKNSSPIMIKLNLFYVLIVILFMVFIVTECITIEEWNFNRIGAAWDRGYQSGIEEGKNIAYSEIWKTERDKKLGKTVLYVGDGVYAGAGSDGGSDGNK